MKSEREKAAALKQVFLDYLQSHGPGYKNHQGVFVQLDVDTPYEDGAWIQVYRKAVSSARD